MQITGFDIADHQGVDFPFVNAFNQNFRFSIIKGSGGKRYQNELGAQQAAAARKAKLAVAFYHYMFEPSVGSGTPEEEFDNFRRAVESMGWQPGESLWLDVEEYPAHGENMVEWIVRFQDACFAHFGFFPGIYTGSYFIQANGLYDVRLTRSALWLASWQDSVPSKTYWKPWTTLAVWQFDAYYHGLTGSDLDCDSFFGTVEEFQALGRRKEDEVQAVNASDIAGTIGKAIDVYRRPDGASAPIDVTFHNPDEPGFGIPYRLLAYVYNPDTGEHYLGEWVIGEDGQGHYQPWVNLGK